MHGVYKYGQFSLDNQNMIQFGNPHTVLTGLLCFYVLDNMPKCDSDNRVIYTGDFGIIEISAQNLVYPNGLCKKCSALVED